MFNLCNLALTRTRPFSTTRRIAHWRSVLDVLDSTLPRGKSLPLPELKNQASSGSLSQELSSHMVDDFDIWNLEPHHSFLPFSTKAMGNLWKFVTSETSTPCPMPLPDPLGPGALSRHLSAKRQGRRCQSSSPGWLYLVTPLAQKAKNWNMCTSINDWCGTYDALFFVSSHYTIFNSSSLALAGTGLEYKATPAPTNRQETIPVKPKGVPKSKKPKSIVKTTSKAEATAFKTESKCFRKKPVTRPTVDMMPMMDRTFTEAMASRFVEESASPAFPSQIRTTKFTMIDCMYMKAFCRLVVTPRLAESEPFRRTSL